LEQAKRVIGNLSTKCARGTLYRIADGQVYVARRVAERVVRVTANDRTSDKLGQQAGGPAPSILIFTTETFTGAGRMDLHENGHDILSGLGEFELRRSFWEFPEFKRSV
jgi:hypothetical protein